MRSRNDGFRVEQFVLSSTMLVHRPGEPGEFMTEDWPIAPTWAYPASKVRTEHLIRGRAGSSSWFAVFFFESTGYVKDDEKLDPDGYDSSSFAGVTHTARRQPTEHWTKVH